jgi:hypothetical protein
MTKGKKQQHYDSHKPMHFDAFWFKHPKMFCVHTKNVRRTNEAPNLDAVKSSKKTGRKSHHGQSIVPTKGQTQQ